MSFEVLSGRQMRFVFGIFGLLASERFRQCFSYGTLPDAADGNIRRS
jgi:hypothetical protein